VVNVNQGYLLAFLLSVAVYILDGVFCIGYGTILTLILLILGFDLYSTIFSVLVAQFVGGIISSIWHHKFKNANFNRGSFDLNIAIIISLTGVFSFIGVLVSVNLNEFLLKLYIGGLTIIIGFLTLTIKTQDTATNNNSTFRVFLVGMFASINKAITGGNYGPTLMLAHILLRIDIKKVLAIRHFAEIFVCGMATIFYLLIGIKVDLQLLTVLVLGTMFAALPSAFIIRKTQSVVLKRFVGFTLISLGMIATMKTLGLIFV